MTNNLDGCLSQFLCLSNVQILITNYGIVSKNRESFTGFRRINKYLRCVLDNAQIFCNPFYSAKVYLLRWTLCYTSLIYLWNFMVPDWNRINLLKHILHCNCWHLLYIASGVHHWNAFKCWQARTGYYYRMSYFCFNQLVLLSKVETKFSLITVSVHYFENGVPEKVWIIPRWHFFVFTMLR